MLPKQASGWAVRAFREITEIKSGALPWPRMLRTGLSLGAAFAVLAFTADPRLGVLAALFGNLLAFIDQAGPLQERLAVVGAGAVLCGLAGALGALVSGHESIIALVTLALGISAGLIHSWIPGVEMIPRQALICFIACAYLPLVTIETAGAAFAGAACVLLGSLADGLIRQRFDSPRIVDAQKSASLPGTRFGLAYGLLVFIGLLVGDALGIARSYWVAITVLVVMQRGRRASVLRAVQRLIGTLIAVVIAFGIVHVLEPSVSRPEFLVLIFVLPFAWPYGLTRNYGFGIILLSVWILLLIDLALPPDQVASEIFLARINDTAIGCALAVFGTILASGRLHLAAPTSTSPR